MTDTITIYTDQGLFNLQAPCTLEAALDHILSASGKDACRVATAVNGQFVSRPARADHLLADGDTVLCFSPITGG